MSIKDVSIPQGVDVKHYNANILHWQSSVSIPQGVDVKHSTGIVLEVVPEVSIPQGVDVKRRCGSIRVLQGRCINPTRGGRQTLLLNYPILHFIMYQSHKGWTSNWGWHVNCSRNGHVSIPQGVDVKLWWLRNRYRGRRCINPTRGGRQTTLHKRNGSPSQVSIPQGVDVKLSLCDLIVYYRQYQSHKGWTSNSPILALMLAF